MRDPSAEFPKEFVTKATEVGFPVPLMAAPLEDAARALILWFRRRPSSELGFLDEIARLGRRDVLQAAGVMLVIEDKWESEALTAELFKHLDPTSVLQNESFLDTVVESRFMVALLRAEQFQIFRSVTEMAPHGYGDFMAECCRYEPGNALMDLAATHGMPVAALSGSFKQAAKHFMLDKDHDTLQQLLGQGFSSTHVPLQEAAESTARMLVGKYADDLRESGAIGQIEGLLSDHRRKQIRSGAPVLGPVMSAP